MKRFRKVYIEISNICNLKCSFCPGTARTPRRMNEQEFRLILQKLKPWTDFIYFHLMGEPLCHPELAAFLRLAGDCGFRVIITTNGSLLSQKQEILLNAPALHKVNISLHAFEANNLSIPFEQYLDHCFSYGKAASGNKLTVFRLWNNGGADTMNQFILDRMHANFPGNWQVERRGTRIADKVYLEHGDKFDWPDLSAQRREGEVFCYGLRDQLGILCDGTVVPCCLDHEGDIPLGNLLCSELSDILASPRAAAIYNGFSNRTASEELCRRCGYASKF